MFLDPNKFDFVRTLEANWRTIKDELDALVPGEFVDWPERQLHGHGWTVFGLVAFGKPLSDNCARCPRTSTLLQSIPGMSMAGFSALAPGTAILPHCGYTTQVLRCHLGLVTYPQAGIRVGHEVRSWEQGKCLVFDDTVEHEAWNHGPHTRIVLLVDFAKAGVGNPYMDAVPAETQAIVESLLSRQRKP